MDQTRKGRLPLKQNLEGRRMCSPDGWRLRAVALRATSSLTSLSAERGGSFESLKSKRYSAACSGLMLIRIGNVSSPRSKAFQWPLNVCGISELLPR